MAGKFVDTRNMHYAGVVNPEKLEDATIEMAEGTAKKEPNIREKKEKRFLRYEFTPQELKERSVRLAKVNREIGEAEAERAKSKKQLDDKIKELEGERSSLSTKVIDGSELRHIECKIVYDYDNDSKTVIRLDTGEQVETGIIPEHERQTELEFDGGNDEL